MTLEELIDYAEKAAKATWNGKPTVSAQEHRQLAEWLKDYKRLLEQESCENAIKYFNTIYNLSQTLGVSYYFIDEQIEKLKAMALKALPQEPCTDAISRSEALKHSFPIYDDDGVGYIVVRADKIEQLPPVKPAEKVGQWIIYDVHGHKACKCSECNNDVGYPCTDKYCKYCGAKMQEVKE